MPKINFEKALEAESDPHRQRMDEVFGEGNDIIASVGTAIILGQAIAFARMIAPDQILPFGQRIDVKRDGEHILFFSSDLLLMAAEWGETVDEFVEAGNTSGYFMFEAVMPDKYQRALVSTDGEVKAVIVREITPDEYEKYLAGFYDNRAAGDGNGTPVPLTGMDVNKTIKC